MNESDFKQKFQRIELFYNLLENNDNDYYVFPFLNLTIELLLNLKLISDKGMTILSRNISLDFQDLKDKKKEKRARMFIALYFLCVYHLCKCYISFINVLMLAEEGSYCDLRKNIENEGLLQKLLKMNDRVSPFVDISKYHLDGNLSIFIDDDQQSKLFDENKRKCIEKEKYFQEDPLYIPAEIPDGISMN